MQKKQNLALYTLAASIFALAAALVYFTHSLVSAPQSSDSFFNSVRQTLRDIQPIVSEVSDVRKQIPAILKESQEIRSQIPAILEEVRAVRKLTPEVLKEVQEIRRVAPGMLKKAEQVVAGAGDISEKASQGVVPGLVTGIITTPFKVVGGLGKLIASPFKSKTAKLTDYDTQLIQSAVYQLVSVGKVGNSQQWKNPESNLSGVVTLKRKSSSDKCYDFNFKIHTDKKIDQDQTLCLNDQSEWEIKE